MSSGAAASSVTAETSEPTPMPAEVPVDLTTLKTSVDLLVVMDCTGSMSSYISAAKATALQTAADIRSEAPNAKYRLGFIGYRDVQDSDRFIEIPLTEDVEAVKRQLAPVSAGGGGDTPEDVAGALNKVLSVNWEADTRIVLMVADAPCHGTSFHDCDDSHPGGDPSGLDPLHLIKEVARRGMDFYFIRCANIVDKMLTQFAAAFEGARANDNQIFSILDLQSQGGGGGYPSEDSLYSTPMPVPCGVPGSTGMPEVYRSMEASSFDISSLSVVDSEKEESAPRRCEAACSDDLVPRPAPSFERRRMEAPGATPMASMSYAMPSSSFSAAMPMPMPSMMSSGGGGDLTSAYASAVTSSVKRSMAARAKPT